MFIKHPQQGLRCQLAKLLKPKGKGRFVWVVSQLPVEMAAESIKTGSWLPTDRRVFLPYWAEDKHGKGGYLVARIGILELWPHFCTRKVTPWKDWEAKGGEPPPEP